MAERESWRNVGQRIRCIRKENCLTLKQLALGCDLSANAISLIERGQVAPTVETLCKIAHALGVSAASLFQEFCSAEMILYRPSDHLSPAKTSDGVAILARLANNPDLTSAALPCQREAMSISQTIVCVCGHITYESDNHSYELDPGDSLTVCGESTGQWRNTGSQAAVMLMVVPTTSAADPSQDE